MIARLLFPIFVLAILLGGCAASPGKRWVLAGPDTCRSEGRFAAAADLNARTLDTLEWAPFGAAERGWRIYAPRIAADTGSPCAPDSADFAARLARWQTRNGLPGDGALTPLVFDRMKTIWQGRRTFFNLRQQGVCPDAPEEATLSPADAEETYFGKAVLLAPGALQALRHMRAAARRDLGEALNEDQSLAVFSGYRSPQYDAERCAREQNCQGVTRAQCSAHRTGKALDLAVGAAPGFGVDASDTPNRLFQSQTPVYRWLVVNAWRFGFANYAFEPWHWEWSGEAPGAAR